MILAIFAVTLGLSAQETNVVTPETGGSVPLKISAITATNYYNEEMIVTGKVAQVTIHPKVIFLNLDEMFPDSPFTVVIFPGHSQFHGDAKTLKGKSIEIKGKIKKYKDKPEMVLDSVNQLTVLGVTNLNLLLNPVAPATSAPANSSPAAPSTNSFPEIM